MEFWNLNHSKFPKIERVMNCWSRQKIMKWPIIFCILRESSIHFLTFSYKRRNEVHILKIIMEKDWAQGDKNWPSYDHLKSHMRNWGFIWRTCNLSSSSSFFHIKNPWNFWSDLLITLLIEGCIWNHSKRPKYEQDMLLWSSKP